MIFFIETTSPKIAKTINCIDGWNDTLFGGPGAVDYLFGGGYNDTIEGNEGMDLVFGDHGSVSFYEESHKLLFSKTSDNYCRGGDDLIRLGDGDDLVSLIAICKLVFSCPATLTKLLCIFRRLAGHTTTKFTGRTDKTQFLVTLATTMQKRSSCHTRTLLVTSIILISQVMIHWMVVRTMTF